MITAAVDFFDVVRWLHLTTVLLAFGPPLAYGMFIAVAQRTDPQALPAVGRAINQWDGTVGTLSMLVVFGTGIYLTIDRFDFGFFFVNWGLAAIIVLFALVHGFFRPQTRKAIELAERDLKTAGGGEPVLSEEFEELNRRLAIAGTAAGLLIVLTVYVMTAKPFT